MSLQDVKDGIARVVGGTQVDPNNRPRWFSGLDAGDGTGISGCVGCWSAAQAMITVAGGGAPGSVVGLVQNGPGNLHYPASTDSLGPSQEYTFHNLNLKILIPRGDPEIEDQALTPYLDLVRAAFRAHTTLFNLANVEQAAPSAWRYGSFTYRDGSQFLGWDFTIRVFMIQTVTYSVG